MKTHLIVIAKDQALFDHRDILYYLGTCSINDHAIDNRVYNWQFDLMETAIQKIDKVPWFVKALDLTIEPTLDDLKGNLQVVFLAPNDGYPSYLVQDALCQYILPGKLGLESSIMHLACVYEDRDYVAQGYSFEIEALAKGQSFFKWMTEEPSTPPKETPKTLEAFLKGQALGGGFKRGEMAIVSATTTARSKALENDDQAF